MYLKVSSTKADKGKLQSASVTEADLFIYNFIIFLAQPKTVTVVKGLVP